MFPSVARAAIAFQAAEEFTAGEELAAQRQQISSYIEGFLQREHTGPEHLEELASMLLKLCGGEEDCNIPLLKESIEILSRAAESREMRTAGHGDLVARYTEILARSLHLPADETVDLIYAARIHDVGKIFVPERILNKPGPLSDDEFFLVRMHARVGAEISGILPRSAMMRQAIERHHERFDGTGYPDGLKGEQIPLWARIISLADAYSNMVTEQSIAAARTPEQALDELAKMSGTGFDGMLVRMLLRELKSERISSSKDSQ